MKRSKPRVGRAGEGKRSAVSRSVSHLFVRMPPTVFLHRPTRKPLPKGKRPGPCPSTYVRTQPNAKCTERPLGTSGESSDEKSKLLQTGPTGCELYACKLTLLVSRTFLKPVLSGVGRFNRCTRNNYSRGQRLLVVLHWSPVLAHRSALTASLTAAPGRHLPSKARSASEPDAAAKS
jgi:hypothetical protein